MGRVGSLSALKFLRNGDKMTKLQELANKLHEYNQRNSTAWALLLCTPSIDEVFIVSEVDNDLSPDWWPNNNTGETIEKALELVPKEETYRYRFLDSDGNLKCFGNNVSKNKYHECLRILGVEL